MRSLGISNLRVASLALGGNVFGWTADKKTSFEILDAFVDFGFNLIDTANMYSTWVPGNKGGQSESIIGEWIKKSRKRDLVCIATKVSRDESNFPSRIVKVIFLRSLRPGSRTWPILFLSQPI